MAFRTQKISQMTPKGADLEATDLIEVSTIESGSYVTRSITGQELIDAIPPTTIEWGDIGGTLSNQTDLNTALNGKVPTTRTLTINGVAQDLSADRSWTISTGLTVGTTPISSGTIGRVLFQGTGNVLQQSSSLFWDSTNNRLGIGTSTPSKYLELKLPTGVNTLNDGIVITRGAGSGIFALTNATSNVNDFIPSIYSKSSIDNAGFYFGASVFSTTSTFPAMEFQSANATNTGAINSGQIVARFANWTSNLLEIRGNGNVLINTTTDAGFRLDVNGTARTGALTVNNGFNLYTGGAFPNTHYLEGLSTSSTDGTLRFRRASDNGWVRLAFGTGSSVQLAANISTGEAQLLAGGGGYFWTIYSNGSERMRIPTTGNVLINTTTDAGFRLDVNGTARVSGAATLAGTNTLSGTTNVSGLSSNWICQYPSNATVKPLSFSAQSGGATSNNVAIQFGFNFRESGGLFTQDIFQNILYDNTTNNVVTGFEWYTHQTQAGSNPSVLAMALRGKTLSIGTNTPNASAVLQADSTTQGFLPPRMTTTQRNAIASPATGLQVYDTTLNRPCFYDGTTWITL